MTKLLTQRRKTKNRPGACLAFGILWLLFAAQPSKSADNDLRIFGYFQNTFQHQDEKDDFIAKSQNTFVMQQLNFFMQKDINTRWSAFVNFEAVNSFSSGRNWGDFSVEEAWVRFRTDNRLNLKLGLQIPTFNHFNEIKNRSPLLPYIVKPLIYDASLADLINIDRVIPTRAFLQAYGFLGAGNAKLDYAAYLGNSPNINSNSDEGQTGVDTTNTFLVGGRIGVRYDELKAGISATYDKDNALADLKFDSVYKQPEGTFSKTGRTRLGADLLYAIGPIGFEGEIIYVRTEEVIPDLDIDLYFYYATLSCQVTDRLLVYGSYWATDEDFILPPDFQPEFLPEEPGQVTGLQKYTSDLRIPTGGISFALNDRITLKGQWAHVRQNIDGVVGDTLDFHYKWDSEYFALGVSVFF